jgi:hypothetical protein
MTICASRMYLGFVNSTAMSPSPVGAIGNKEQQPGALAQIRYKPPAPSYRRYLIEGTYNLNTGGPVEIAPPGTTSISV